MSRRKYNMKIMDMLYQYVMNNPDQRFSQILRNIDIISETELEFVPDSSKPEQSHKQLIWENEFNLESATLYERVRESLGIEETCGFCQSPCGNDHCPTKGDKDE